MKEGVGPTGPGDERTVGATCDERTGGPGDERTGGTNGTRWSSGVIRRSGTDQTTPGGPAMRLA